MTGLLLGCLLASASAAEDDVPVSEETPASVETPVVDPAVGPYPVVWPGQITPAAAKYWDLEVAYHEGRFEDVVALSRLRLASDATDADAAWHFVRSLYELGERFDPADASIDRVAFYREMVDALDVAIAAHPDDPHLRFARGVANGRYGTTRGVLASLFLARPIEQDWLMTADSGLVYSSIGGEEVLPCDVWYGLGIYYRLVPDWWLVKVIAGTRGDLDLSRKYLIESDMMCPDRIRTLKEIGVTDLCMASRRGDDEARTRGLAVLGRAADIPAVTDVHRIDARHVVMLQKDPSLACGYSRDGQQELDQQKLK